MDILRHYHGDDITLVPSKIYDDKHLNATDLGMLSYLLYLSNGGTVAVNIFSAIRKNDSIEEIEKSIKKLEEEGYLIRNGELIEIGKKAYE